VNGPRQLQILRFAPPVDPEDAKGYVVAVRSLRDDDVLDVLTVFADSDAGLRAARAYVADVTDRNRRLLDGR
jgi:hypothetical protein